MTKPASYIPSPQEGLLLRSPITQAYTPPNYYSKTQLYSRNVRPEMNAYHTSILDDDNAHNSVSFYTRHNPHPVRVKHMKGLLGNPVCMVEDNLERRILWSAPSGEDLSISYRPPGSTRYSANTSKHLPAVGIVPVTYAWKDELEKKTYNAISKALGQTPTQYETTASKRNTKETFDTMDDEQLLNMLCKILQTDSIPACQAWLQSASDTEKTIVLNMLRMAATGEIGQLAQSQTAPNHTCRPNTAQSLYIWNPQNSGLETTKQLQVDHHPQEQHQPWSMDPVSLDGMPFKLPTHDTIIRSAHSRLSMRKENGIQNFHDRLQSELDQKETRRPITRGSSKQISVYSRPTSAGLLPRPFSQIRNRPRSRSAGSRVSKTEQLLMLTPPVRVQVSGALRRSNS